MEHKTNTSINYALGVSDEWMKNSSSSLSKDMDTYETASETLVEAAKRIKMEEFDLSEDEVTISDYEKKLLLTGLQLTELAIKKQDMKIAQKLGAFIAIAKNRAGDSDSGQQA